MLFLLVVLGIAEACQHCPLSHPCLMRFLDQNLNMTDVLQATSVRLPDTSCTTSVISSRGSSGGDPLKFTCFGSFGAYNLSCSNEVNDGLVAYELDCSVSC